MPATPITPSAPPAARRASRPTGWRLVTGVYNLALGVWLGAMVMLAIAAPIIFATVRGYDVTVHAQPYAQPALADQQTPIVAGGLVGEILKGLSVVQVVCLVIVVVCGIVQHTAFADRLRGRVAGVWRWLLIAVAAAVLALNMLYIGPTMDRHRAVMYGSDTAPAPRAAARAAFDVCHVWTTRTFSVATFCLLGAVLASPFAYREPASTALSPAEAR